MVKPREKRVPIMLSDDEMKKIDDWRFENRVATRSEAIRRLCQMGVAFHETLPELDVATKMYFLRNRSSISGLDASKTVKEVAKNALDSAISYFEMTGDICFPIMHLKRVAEKLNTGSNVSESMNELEELKKEFKKIKEDYEKMIIENEDERNSEID